MYLFIHTTLDTLLHETILSGVNPSCPPIIWVLFLLLGGSTFGLWLAHKRSSTAFTVIYLWLVHLGEPHKEVVESHPTYLAKSLFYRGASK